mmetsp:Transcript_13098/g.15815  ORF Transcript_13098/g.15815 Transcript_13098/m.15815 type:complete len:423 (+) Transcript_13098:394-1662(+)
MIRTRIERSIFFFLLTVVVVRIMMVGHFSAPSHGAHYVHESDPSLVRAEPAEQTKHQVSEKSAVDPTPATQNMVEDSPEPAAEEETVEEKMAAREAAAEKVAAAESKAIAEKDVNEPVKIVKNTKIDHSGGDKNQGRKAGKKEAGANWHVLDNLRLVEDGTKLVTHKRQFIVFNQTLNHTVLRHWLEYEDDNETLVYHFPRSLFELLPLEEPQWHFKTCAVVGNSGVVLLRENGKEIDNHEAIMRINMAPVRGYEHYVGKKTTFNVVNSHNVRELLQGIRHWTGSPEGESRLVMFETASHFARYHLLQPLLKKFPQARPILLNPIFSNRAHRVWVQLKYLFEQKENNQYNRKPMSGFFAVFFALNICEKVDLYGFDAYTSKKRSYRYHYFDNVQGFTDVHSFDLAIEVYKLIEEKGLVSIIT